MIVLLNPTVPLRLCIRLQKCTALSYYKRLHAVSSSVHELLLEVSRPLEEVASLLPTRCFFTPRWASVETPSKVLALLACEVDLGLHWWLAIAEYWFLLLWHWKAVFEVEQDVKVLRLGGSCSRAQFALAHILRVLLHVVEVVISRDCLTFALWMYPVILFFCIIIIIIIRDPFAR